MQNNNEKKVVELNLDDVLPNRFQPRIKFDEESINELAMSIKKYGVIQPIVVRQIGDKYEIIAGERRYKASRIAGKQTIPAIIYELSDKDSVEIALLENVQREDLTPIEKAISYKKILDMGYINQEDLAQKIGKSQSAIANTLRLLNLAEEVQEALLETKISERHARSLLKVKDEKQQVTMLNRIINERLTVRKTDEEIEKMLNNEINNDSVVSIPDVKEQPNDNFDLPGFMDIDKIENQAQDIIKEEKPIADINSLLTPSPIMNNESSNDSSSSSEDVLRPGKFFNLFDDDKENKEMEELLSGNYSVNNNQTQGIPEFNFEQPATEIPSVEPAIPEFNFEQPATEIPSVEPVMPEFNFEQPTSSSPVIESTIPEPPIVDTNISAQDSQTDDSGNQGSHRGGFFNLFGKKKSQPIESQPMNAQLKSNDFETPIDFNNDTIPNVDNTISSLSTPDILTIPTEDNVEQSISESRIVPNIRLAIDTIRNCEENLQNMGFTIDVEEIDFEGSYQVIFKINK